MENTSKPIYAELLERSAYYLRRGYLNTARGLAADAIDMMEPTFAPNNPKLADAYRLHARICYTHYRASQSGSQHLPSWRKSAEREIEILSLGMDTDRLAQAKFDFGRLVEQTTGVNVESAHIDQAVAMKARLHELRQTEALYKLLTQFLENERVLANTADSMEVGSLTG